MPAQDKTRNFVLLIAAFFVVLVFSLLIFVSLKISKLTFPLPFGSKLMCDKVLTEKKDEASDLESETNIFIKANTAPNLPVTLIEVMGMHKNEGEVSKEDVDFEFFDEVSKIESVDVETNALSVVTIVSKDPNVIAGTKKAITFACDIDLAHFVYGDASSSLLMECLRKEGSEEELNPEIKLIDCIHPEMYIAYECNDSVCINTGDTCIFYE